MDDHAACEKCRWWDSSIQQTHKTPDTTGACRVSAPKINKITGGAMWPFTEDSDWCACFTPSTVTEHLDGK
jgi:hypothetical protein